MAATNNPDSRLTNRCAKCGGRLPGPALMPALCPKCELVNALLVERYTTHQRDPEDENG